MNTNQDILALRAAFKTPEKTQNSKFPRTNSDHYIFWDMPVGSQCVVRFLPDKTEGTNLKFLVEKFMHKLIINGKKRNVACPKYHKVGKCPICEASSKFYDAGDKITGKKYYRSASYIAQALILENSVPAPQPPIEGYIDPVGQVKFLDISFSLYRVIKESIESGELDLPPYFFNGGTDFIIKKDLQGDKNSYVLSKFSRKSTDLDPEVVDYVKQEMKELRTALPTPYSYEKLQAMLTADMTGTEYVEEKATTTDASTSVTPTPSVTAAVSITAPTPVAAPTPVSMPTPVAAPTPVQAAGQEDDPQARAKSLIDQIKRNRAAAAQTQ